MRLALDHHYASAIAVQSRDRDHDVVTAVERGWQTLSDVELLDACDDEKRALLTNNVADFVALALEWSSAGRTHSGLIFTSDVSMPRGKGSIGVYVTALDRLLLEHAETGLPDQIHWLRP